MLSWTGSTTSNPPPPPPLIFPAAKNSGFGAGSVKSRGGNGQTGKPKKGSSAQGAAAFEGTGPEPPRAKASQRGEASKKRRPAGIDVDATTASERRASSASDASASAPQSGRLDSAAAVAGRRGSDGKADPSGSKGRGGGPDWGAADARAAQASPGARGSDSGGEGSHRLSTASAGSVLRKGSESLSAGARTHTNVLCLAWVDTD